MQDQGKVAPQTRETGEGPKTAEKPFSLFSEAITKEEARTRKLENAGDLEKADESKDGEEDGEVAESPSPARKPEVPALDPFEETSAPPVPDTSSDSEEETGGFGDIDQIIANLEEIGGEMSSDQKLNG